MSKKMGRLCTQFSKPLTLNRNAFIFEMQLRSEVLSYNKERLNATHFVHIKDCKVRGKCIWTKKNITGAQQVELDGCERKEGCGVQ